MKKYTDTGKRDTRSGFGEGLLTAGRADSRVLALTADLKGSVKMGAFAKEFPDRFYQCGIAEANMVGAAAGLAIGGKIPFIGSFAEFVTGRVYDQLRQEVAYSRTNVKIASSHAGITLGEDGATHQTMEDIALMRALPGMTVLVPCDYNQTRNATIAAAQFDGPVYLRFGRPAVPNFTDPDEPFEIGKIYVLDEGADVSIFACGHLVWEALRAAECRRPRRSGFRRARRILPRPRGVRQRRRPFRQIRFSRGTHAVLRLHRRAHRRDGPESNCEKEVASSFHAPECRLQLMVLRKKM